MKAAIILVLYFVTNGLYSQSFYEITWTTSNGIKYTALVEFFEKENINVRVKYKNNDSQYKVAKYKCTGRYHTSDDGVKYFIFDGYDAIVVYPTLSSKGYFADNFIFTSINEDNKFEKLYHYDDKDLEDGEINDFIEAEFRALNPKIDFTESYVYSFFEKNEPEFAQYTSLSLGNHVTTDYYKLKFKNSCHVPVKTLIRFQSFDGKWETKGWYSIQPGKTIYIEDSKNSIYYFYAISVDGDFEWKGTDNKQYFEGSEYGFRKLTKSTLTYGDWVSDLTCKSSTESVTTYDPATISNIKLHLIVAADIDDFKIGQSTRQDITDVTSLFKKASKELGIQCEVHQLAGNNFDLANFNSVIKNIQVTNNDLIIFYYSGHGYNNPNGFNTFPNMQLDGPDMGLEYLHNQLNQKKARLTLTIGDLCNSIPRPRDGSKGETEIPFKSGFMFDTDKLAKLLVLSKGHLLSTSSKRGEWSWCITNSDGSLGNGHFTNAFINAFTKETSKVSNAVGSWQTLFESAYLEVKNKTSNQQNQNGDFGQHGYNISNIN